VDECITLEAVGKMACNGEVLDIKAGTIVPKNSNEMAIFSF